MTAKKVTLEAPMMRCSFGYSTEFIISWEDGLLILQALKSMQFVESRYENNKTTWYAKAKQEFKMEVFSPAEQAELLMNGVKEET